MEEDIQKNDKNNRDGGKILYQCKECGFHYADKDIAEKCEAWCREHKTCNVEITKSSEENKKVSSEIREENSIPYSSELEICRKRSEEYLNNWKRERADFLNYKKDEMERFASFAGYAKEKIILEILPILDSFYIAEKHSDILQNVRMSEVSEWVRGFKQIKKQIEEFLKKEGIEEIKTIGEMFNAETMEAVGEISNFPAYAEASAGKRFPISSTVVEELQKGYTMNGKVIRPAKVKVAK